MVLELVGSRMLSPYFGSSMIIWTSLIGVILGSLSVGYYLGGKISDKEKSYNSLGIIVFFSGLYLLVVYLGYKDLLDFLSSLNLDIRITSLISAVVLFVVPNILLGMVSPYCAKLRINKIDNAGSVVGNLYAISTAGSIFGTFFAGFFLITTFGTRTILLFISLTIIALSMSLIDFKKIRLPFKLLFIVIISISIFAHFSLKDKSVVSDFDTEYARYFVVEGLEKQTDRPVRMLTLWQDWSTVESAIYSDNGDPIGYGYTGSINFFDDINKNSQNILLIGGGTLTMPRIFLKQSPNSLVDVVEIDGELLEVAKKYFYFSDDHRIKNITADGRTFINHQNVKKYDGIYIDAFKSSDTIPYQLTTREALSGLDRIMKEDGLVMTNILASISGKGSVFLSSEYLTYKEVFPHVLIFAMGDPANHKAVQNFVILASRMDFSSEINVSKVFDAKKQIFFSEDNLLRSNVLTDDYAPVDQYFL